MTKLTILGAGNFGYALAAHLDRKRDPKLDLWLYARRQELVDHINHTHTHPELYPTVELERITATTSLEACTDSCDVLVLAVASTGLEPVLASLQPLITRPLAIVSIMKALDPQTGKVLGDTIVSQLQGLPVTLAVLAGGTTGASLVSEQYLGATIACNNPTVLDQLAHIFQSPYLRLQKSTDVIGTQYAGALKNVISVGVGLTKGLGFAYGTQTHVLSLLASECEHYALAHGAQEATFRFASQCWGNDMVMSSTDPDTRNHQFGILLGEGLQFHDAVAKMQAAGRTAEGANTLAVLARTQQDLSSYPLFSFLVQLAAGHALAGEIVNIIETHP